MQERHRPTIDSSQKSDNYDAVHPEMCAMTGDTSATSSGTAPRGLTHVNAIGARGRYAFPVAPPASWLPGNNPETGAG
ncbi:MAG: hypothetical protein AWU55_2957 [Halomonadaceae bacterium T82-2]|nr:MAG: hypothetical protein AWU55_2957 [Halomonadaceae bacterium T82-2]